MYDCRGQSAQPHIFFLFLTQYIRFCPIHLKCPDLSQSVYVCLFTLFSCIVFFASSSSLLSIFPRYSLLLLVPGMLSALCCLMSLVLTFIILLYSSWYTIALEIPYINEIKNRWMASQIYYTRFCSSEKRNNVRNTQHNRQQSSNQRKPENRIQKKKTN